jgi:hypothetical protein
MDVEKFVRHLCRLVLRHQMPVWNYFVNSFYSDCGTQICSNTQLSLLVGAFRTPPQIYGLSSAYNS